MCIRDRLYTKEQAIRQMNYLGQSCRPFIFIIKYQHDASYIEAVSSVDPAEILYNLNGFTNQPMFAAVSYTHLDVYKRQASPRYDVSSADNSSGLSFMDI